MQNETANFETKSTSLPNLIIVVLYSHISSKQEMFELKLPSFYCLPKMIDGLVVGFVFVISRRFLSSVNSHLSILFSFETSLYLRSRTWYECNNLFYCSKTIYNFESIYLSLTSASSTRFVNCLMQSPCDPIYSLITSIFLTPPKFEQLTLLFFEELSSKIFFVVDERTSRYFSSLQELASGL